MQVKNVFNTFLGPLYVICYRPYASLIRHWHHQSPHWSCQSAVWGARKPKRERAPHKRSVATHWHWHVSCKEGAAQSDIARPGGHPRVHSLYASTLWVICSWTRAVRSVTKIKLWTVLHSWDSSDWLFFYQEASCNNNTLLISEVENKTYCIYLF